MSSEKMGCTKFHKYEASGIGRGILFEGTCSVCGKGKSYLGKGHILIKIVDGDC